MAQRNSGWWGLYTIYVKCLRWQAAFWQAASNFAMARLHACNERKRALEHAS